MRRIRPALFGATVLALTAGCQTVRSEGVAANVNMNDPSTRAAVTAVLAQAVHRRSVELGPTSPDTAVLTVLPPPPGPYETNSPVMPIRFLIVLEGRKCRAVREDTKDSFDLPGVTCTKAG
ncbi:MAG: hypothetical protein ACXU8O_01200 [Asticcacaulis sp.]